MRQKNEFIEFIETVNYDDFLEKVDFAIQNTDCEESRLMQKNHIWKYSIGYLYNKYEYIHSSNHNNSCSNYTL